eukprot:scaffold168_cov220-Chaetoceros_neogracile.AAC.12
MPSILPVFLREVYTIHACNIGNLQNLLQSFVMGKTVKNLVLYKYLKELSFDYAFLLDQLGLSK